MALALAAIVTLSVGVPIAAWSWTRLRPPPAPSRLGTGYDSIDKWLLRRHGLPPIDRERVRTSVFAGRQLGDPQLALAAHDLAVKLLNGEITGARVPAALRWVNLLSAVVFAALGIGALAVSRRPGMQAVGVFWLTDSAMFTLISVFYIRQLKKIRHRIEAALELNQDHTA